VPIFGLVFSSNSKKFKKFKLKKNQTSLVFGLLEKFVPEIGKRFCQNSRYDARCSEKWVFLLQAFFIFL